MLGNDCPENLQPQLLQAGSLLCTTGYSHLPCHRLRVWACFVVVVVFPMSLSHPKCLTPRSGWSWLPGHAQGILLLREQNAQLKMTGWPLLTSPPLTPPPLGPGKEQPGLSRILHEPDQNLWMMHYILIISDSKTVKLEAEEGREIYPLKMAGNLEERYHSNKCLIETRSLLPHSCFLSLLPNQFTCCQEILLGEKEGQKGRKESLTFSCLEHPC